MQPVKVTGKQKNCIIHLIYNPKQSNPMITLD